jgi:hypothetical protein
MLVLGLYKHYKRLKLEDLIKLSIEFDRIKWLAAEVASIPEALRTFFAKAGIRYFAT